MENEFISFELKKITNAIKRNLDNLLENKLTHTQVFILFFIKMQNDKGIKVYPKNIENFLQNRRSTVWEILNTMEKSKLIKKIGVSDFKLREIILDQEGLEFVNKFQDIIRTLEKDMLKDITSEELSNFYLVIRKIERNLEDVKIV